MGASWRIFSAGCKSRLSAIARSCYLRRWHWFQRCEDKRQQNEDLRVQLEQAQARCRLLEKENESLRKQIEECETRLAQPQPMTLPIGEKPRGLHYGKGLIVLCVNLARQVGLRPAVAALKIFFEWLEVDVPIPTYQAVRGWMQRIGLHGLQNTQRIDGNVWLTDHSIQIGKERLLVIVRVPEKHPGVPVRQQDVEFLTIQPSENNKTEDVGQVYRETAERCGTPRAVASDGALELRDPVETLKNSNKQKPLSLRDPKHYFANVLKAMLEREPRFEAFTKHIGGLRSALQQTELAHFIPLGMKTKSRFMNLKPTLNWGVTVLWHLEHPESKSREGISESRLNDKFGWLPGFAPDIQQWAECQSVISAGLTFLNQEGLSKGVAKKFQRHVSPLARCAMSKGLVKKAAKFLRDQEKKLKPGERLTMSTEIVESAFALYKQFEQQHSKSGFTSLVLAFPLLLKPTTAEEVTEAFANVTDKDVRQWVKDNVPRTLAAKRRLLFQEAKPKKKKGATQKVIAT